jgi:hypothetical protein
MTKAEQEALYTNTVIPAIRENGKAVTLIKPNDGTYDPVLGFVDGEDVESQGYALEIATDYNKIPAHLMGTVKKTVMAIEISKPENNKDKLLIDGNEMLVLGFLETKPGEVNFFYTLFLGG